MSATRSDPIETKTYRGLTAYKAGESVIASVGPWLQRLPILVAIKPPAKAAIAYPIRTITNVLIGTDCIYATISSRDIYSMFLG